MEKSEGKPGIQGNAELFVHLNDIVMEFNANLPDWVSQYMPEHLETVFSPDYFALVDHFSQYRDLIKGGVIQTSFYDHLMALPL